MKLPKEINFFIVRFYHFAGHKNALRGPDFVPNHNRVKQTKCTPTYTMDHLLNDVILCLLLQLPECIAYSLSNNVMMCMVYFQLTTYLNGILIEFQNFSNEWYGKHVLV